jgi:adenosylcobinamide-phosphate synthase
MAAGAGSLGVSLGGAAIYHGQEEIRPPLGAGPAPVAADLGRAIVLIRHSLWLWLAVLFVMGILNA